MHQGLKNSPQIYRRTIDNAFVGINEGRTTTDIALVDDVFHRGVAEGTQTSHVIYRRSYIDYINFGSKDWTELCVMLHCLLESWGITISLPKAHSARSLSSFSAISSREMDQRALQETSQS
ncbi:TPA: hypothetical protein N0F65_007849 [Lagenidium giganteum]|uniref:Reverse transcriptase domain-containing protein n=1 Tax=Lagenidium giganteum TaxID=4803 RepID=A0AAV2YH85_9STRA|nr:TPA: hypothetical protein N0F65_007849 [Lagenidium giganteum]